MNSTLRELAAGVLAVGFDGTSLDPVVTERLRTLPLAGVVLFARNIESVDQTRALSEEIRALLRRDGRDPIVGIDQEGGRVARLRNGVEEFPSMMALGATGDETLADAAGEQLGFDLRRAGVNVDFAPVLDLARYRANTVIGARSFGDDPREVVRLAGALARGLERAGIVATFKHFPGHGSTSVDSHLDLPAIEDEADVMRSRDLAPFASLLPSARAVMSAHILFRSFDEKFPATLSASILTSLLREEIGFKGVCFTDCMQMEAIASSVGTAAGAVQAIRAGADCVLISHSMDLAESSAQAIAVAVENGSLSEGRLREAFERVQHLRAQLQPPLAASAPPPYRGIGEEIGRRAVTLVRGEPHAEPRECVVVSFEGTTVEGVQGMHSQHSSLKAYAPDVLELFYPLDPAKGEAARAIEQIARTGRRPLVLLRRAHVYASQAEIASEIATRYPDALLVSVREPFDAFEFPAARNVLCTYGDDAPSMAGLARVVFGGETPSGRLPLELHAVN